MFIIICNILYYVGLIVVAAAFVASITKATNIIEHDYKAKQNMKAQGILIEEK